MAKRIATELYNYNKFPGPEFHLHGDKVETEGIAFFLGGKYQGLPLNVTAFQSSVFQKS